MKKNWKRIAGMMAFMLGIGLTPIQAARADVEVNMGGSQQETIETAPEVDVLEMTEEQLQYAFFGVDWEGEMETWYAEISPEELVYHYYEDDDIHIKWNYEGTIVRKVPKFNSWEIERGGDSKALHFSTEAEDYYIGIGYKIESDGEYKVICCEITDKNSKQSTVFSLYGVRCNEMDENADYIKYFPKNREHIQSYYSQPDAWLARAIEAKPAKTAKDDTAYKVKKGDTLSSIATKFYGNNANRYNIKSYNETAFKATNGRLKPGMEILIPATLKHQNRLPEITLAKGEKIYTVKLGDTLFTISREQLGNGDRYKEIFERNKDRIKKINMIYEGQEIVLPAK